MENGFTYSKRCSQGQIKDATERKRPEVRSGAECMGQQPPKTRRRGASHQNISEAGRRVLEPGSWNSALKVQTCGRFYLQIKSGASRGHPQISAMRVQACPGPTQHSSSTSSVGDPPPRLLIPVSLPSSPRALNPKGLIPKHISLLPQSQNPSEGTTCPPSLRICVQSCRSCSELLSPHPTTTT